MISHLLTLEVNGHGLIVISGNDARLRTGPRSPFAGDWLTHIRMEICKWMRMLAPHPNEHFAHLGPIVGEMWHNKQDLLEVMMLMNLSVNS